MANWIETKVRYEKTLENGTKKMVSETYWLMLSSSRKQKLVLQKKSLRICRGISVYRQ